MEESMSYVMDFSDSISVNELKVAIDIINEHVWSPIEMPKYDNKLKYYYWSSKECKEWIDSMDNLTLTPEKIKKIGQASNMMFDNHDSFQIGLIMVNIMSWVTKAIRAKCSDYIMEKAVECGLVGKEKKEYLRKCTKEFRLIFG